MQPDVLADVVVQTVKRALAPVLADVRGLQAQNAAWEARWGDLGALRERVAVVEAKAALPAPVVLEARTAAPDSLLVDLRARVAALETAPAELAGVRERLAVLETRAPGPGPAGRDGVDGKDGADGLGFDDLGVEYDGDRTLAVRFVRGDQVKAFPLALPFLKYQGVYQDGETYVAGDVVTWAGAMWAANEPTLMKPGEYAGAKVWTLCVKKGRDGKDGKDGAPAPAPVVSVGGGR
jgi:hypothetical protein